MNSARPGHEAGLPSDSSDFPFRVGNPLGSFVKRGSWVGGREKIERNEPGPYTHMARSLVVVQWREGIRWPRVQSPHPSRASKLIRALSPPPPFAIGRRTRIDKLPEGLPSGEYVFRGPWQKKKKRKKSFVLFRVGIAASSGFQIVVLIRQFMNLSLISYLNTFRLNTCIMLNLAMRAAALLMELSK
ncbi:hypothetical protein LY78DRAFT_186169 [Colletotrichum sublineola]|nr:hypothetical protein LY78DRAFT_186169 [Colletotrichum sublineola]